MNETHRFLRYVLPGASFTIEALLLLLLLLPEWTDKLVKVGNAGLWSAIVIFLGMGGIGFLLSILYHLFREDETFVGHDHRPVVERLRNRKILELLNAEDGVRLDLYRPNRHQAWVIVNALWHQRVKENPRLSGANPRINSLADLVHSIGTAMWGALFAAIIPFLVAFFVAALSLDTIGVLRFVAAVEPIDILRFVAAVELAIFLLAMHLRAYKQISRTAELLIAEIIEDTLRDSSLESGIAERTYVDIR